jgi:undecaprenyl pyrophosphate phosphatase UppP
MASKATLMWVQRLVWINIYGGLLAIVLGVFLARTDEALARAIQRVGGVFVLIGVVLIYVRSLLKETPSQETRPTR